MHNLAKFAHLRKFIVVQKTLIQKMWCIGEIIIFLITSCKRFCLKFPFYAKVKGTKKGLTSLLQSNPVNSS
jgi:hypothetical protein